mmetsp:Transcript_3078/g.2604  ORF Transcript_3078/g.2604 Transcript_3078/m.2604 type:complete len:158 (-) Transcript_3078:15-488(-)
MTRIKSKSHSSWVVHKKEMPRLQQMVNNPPSIDKEYAGKNRGHFKINKKRTNSMDFADIVNYINTCDDVEFVVDENAQTLGNEVMEHLQQMADDEFEVVEDPRSITPRYELNDEHIQSPTIEGFGSESDNYQEDQDVDDEAPIIEAGTSIVDKSGEF